MTWGPLAQAGGRLTPEPRGGGASPPEPHKGGAGYRMGCSREKGKTQPPPRPPGWSSRGRPAPSCVVRTHGWHLSSAQLAHSAASAAGRLCVCVRGHVRVCGHVCVCGHTCVFSQVLAHHSSLQDAKCSSLCGSSRTVSLTQRARSAVCVQPQSPALSQKL